ncbi:hypothetical protein EDC01DRAFT_759100 [Geopyxis carbonaria]|nr:hypothetical protein EDC01DRAFT_759100 [Geopyxis carbonaria]
MSTTTTNFLLPTLATLLVLCTSVLIACFLGPAVVAGGAWYLDCDKQEEDEGEEEEEEKEEGEEEEKEEVVRYY